MIGHYISPCLKCWGLVEFSSDAEEHSLFRQERLSQVLPYCRTHLIQRGGKQLLDLRVGI